MNRTNELKNFYNVRQNINNSSPGFQFEKKEMAIENYKKKYVKSINFFFIWKLKKKIKGFTNTLS